MIRAAVIGDAPQIATLWNAMIRETLATFTTVEKTHEDIARMIDARKAAFLVADHAGTVAGFVTFAAFRDGPGYRATVEHTVIVAPSKQRQSVGKDLMHSAEKLAQEQSKHVMVAAISGANPQAVRFHSALGFVETARMPEVGHKNGQWLDLILMQKTL